MCTICQPLLRFNQTTVSSDCCVCGRPDLTKSKKNLREHDRILKGWMVVTSGSGWGLTSGSACVNACFKRLDIIVLFMYLSKALQCKLRYVSLTSRAQSIQLQPLLSQMWAAPASFTINWSSGVAHELVHSPNSLNYSSLLTNHLFQLSHMPFIPCALQHYHTSISITLW